MTAHARATSRTDRDIASIDDDRESELYGDVSANA